MARKGDARDRMDSEQDTTTEGRDQQRQTQPDDQWAGQGSRHEGQQQRRRKGEPGWQPDTGSGVDLQTASREELETLAFELDIDAFESMDREDLVSAIEERN